MQIDAIKIRNLYKIFGTQAETLIGQVTRGMGKAELLEKHRHVLGLRDINLDIVGGRIQVIMGLSGSGKSTLIRHINRLIEPTSGQVLVDSVDVCRMDAKSLREFRRSYTAMVFQKFALLPHWTARENVMFGLKIQGVPRDSAIDTAMRWIERVGLKGYEDKYPNQLSGGMQQRVGLARALVNDAPILLMDEAFSALDPMIRVDMQSVLLGLQKEIRKTIVFITHDLDEALRIGDDVAILRDGEIVQNGTPEMIVRKPADDYVENFVRDVNRGRVIGVGAVMTASAPGEAPAEGMPKVSAASKLEDAAALMSQSRSLRAVVIDDTGNARGTVDLADIIAAMVRPAEVAMPKPQRVNGANPAVEPPERFVKTVRGMTG
jgi:glycine betaine/proline transport system ATP-binding protein